MSVQINKVQAPDALSKLLSIASVAGGVMTGNPLMIAGGAKGLKDSNQTSNAGASQGIPAPDGDAMKRKLDAQNMAVIHQGLEHLNDPNVQMPYPVREKAYMALLGVKHFGQGGHPVNDAEEGMAP